MNSEKTVVNDCLGIVECREEADEYHDSFSIDYNFLYERVNIVDLTNNLEDVREIQLMDIAFLNQVRFPVMCLLTKSPFLLDLV